MTIGTGFGAIIGHTNEATWGDAFQSPTKWMRIISESLELLDPAINRKLLSQPTSLSHYRGRKTVPGQVVTDFLYTGREGWLANCFGSVADDAATSSPNYIHTYKLVWPTTTAVEGLSVRAEKDAGYFDFFGIKVNTQTFDITDLEILRQTFGCIGKDQNAWNNVDASAGTPVDLDTYTPSLDTFTFDYGGASTNIQSGTITIDKKLSGDRPNVGTRVILEPIPTDWFTVSGTIVKDFDSTDFATGSGKYYDFVNNSSPALTYKYEESGPGMAIEIFVPKVRLDGETPKVGGPGVIPVNINWVGEYDSTVGSAIQLKLVNDVADGETG